MDTYLNYLISLLVVLAIPLPFVFLVIVELNLFIASFYSLKYSRKLLIKNNKHGFVHKLQASKSLFIDVSKKSIYQIWTISGLALIFSKLKIIKADGEKFPSFIPWILTLYFTFFGIANQNYTNHLNQLLSEKGRYISQLKQTNSPKEQKMVLQNIIDLGVRTLPTEPAIKFIRFPNVKVFFEDTRHRIPDEEREFSFPLPTRISAMNPFRSFFGERERNDKVQSEIINLLLPYQEDLIGFRFINYIINGYKIKNSTMRSSEFFNSQFFGYLENINLNDANINNVIFREVLVKKITLKNASIALSDFSNAYCDFSKQSQLHLCADFSGARIVGSDFREVLFQDVNFRKSQFNAFFLKEERNRQRNSFNSAVLWKVDFKGAKLDEIRFSNAFLIECDFREITYPSKKKFINSLLLAKTLYLTKLPTEIKVEIERVRPDLFIKPTSSIHKLRMFKNHQKTQFLDGIFSFL